MGRGDAKRKPLARKKNVLSELSLQSARNVTAAPMIRRLARRECDPTPESSVSASVSAETTNRRRVSGRRVRRGQVRTLARVAARVSHQTRLLGVRVGAHVFLSPPRRIRSERAASGTGFVARASRRRGLVDADCRRRLGPDWATPRTNRTDSRSVSTQPSRSCALEPGMPGHRRHPSPHASRAFAPNVGGSHRYVALDAQAGFHARKAALIRARADATARSRFRTSYICPLPRPRGICRPFR